MTTSADPSSTEPSQPSSVRNRLNDGWATLVRLVRPQRSDRDTIETILESPNHDETSGFGADERKMLSNILQLKDRTVEDVLVPRAEIIAVEVDASIDDVIEVAAAEGHSRLPVYGEDKDDIRGLVHIKDLLAAKARGSNEGLRSILRPPIFVAPSMPVLDMLLDMRTKRRHMAFVVDEHGGIDGLLTIEDLVEEIVGDIQDEHDEDNGEIITVGENEFEAHARLELTELENRIGTFLTTEDREEDFDTLGGLVFSLAGRIPIRGEVLTHASGWRFMVMDADPRRIRRVHIEPATNPLRRRRRLAVAAGAAEDTTAGAVEETTAGAVEETTAGAAEKTTAGAAEETMAGAGEETAAGAAEDTTAGAVEETTAGAADDHPLEDPTTKASDT